MESPWHSLPEAAPFVLPSDASYVAAYNARAKQSYQIRLEALPEPFFGAFDARVVILLQNPGFSRDGNHVPETQSFIQQLRAYLQVGAAPHLHLAPNATGPGHDWWMRVTKPLRDATDRAQLAGELLSIEYFPYHSISFAHAHLRLPSQQFSFNLVRKAIARGSEIIIARGYELWLGAVPELANYPNTSRLSSAQNSSLSSKNLGPESFARIVHALSRAGVV